MFLLEYICGFLNQFWAWERKGRGASSILPSSLDSLVSIIEEKSEFSEVDVNSLKIGDIVLIGQGCKQQYSIGIVGLPKDSNNKIYIYTNLKSMI